MKPHNVQPWFIHYLPPAVSIKSIHTTGLKMYWNACTFTQQVTWLNCYLKTGRNRKYNSFLFCLQYGLDGRLRCKNRIKGLLMYYGISVPLEYQEKKCWSKRFVNWLKQQLTTVAGTSSLQFLIEDLEYHRTKLLAVLRKIKQLLKERFKEEWDLLLSIPGIGPLNVVTLLSEIGDIKRFITAARFANYLGLLPSEASSDETIIIKGINPRCNKYLRSMLVEAVWVAIRTSPSLLAYYKKHSYKDSNKAIIKVTRKLAMIIRGVWLNKESYKEGFISKKKDPSHENKPNAA